MKFQCSFSECHLFLGEYLFRLPVAISMGLLRLRTHHSHSCCREAGWLYGLLKPFGFAGKQEIED